MNKELCKKCILPHDYVGISINKNGICNYCEDYKPTEYLGNKILKQRILKLSKNGNQSYDCIVGFSGGRDSTYLLWYVVTKLHLKPLAVFVDSKLIPEQTILNIKNTVKILGVDLIIKQHDYLKNAFKHHLQAWLKRPVPETLITFCVGCRLGFKKFLYDEAIKRAIPVVLSGGSPFEGKQYKSKIIKSNPNNIKISSFIIGYIKQLILNPIIASNYFGLKTQFNEFYYTYFGLEKKLRKYNIYRIAPYHHYIRWEEKLIENTLIKELGWKRHPELNSSYRGDCKIGLIRQHFYYKLLGYNDKDDHLSCLIRDGQITREDAIKRIEKERDVSVDFLKEIFSEMGLDYYSFIEKINKIPHN
jgi:hypothetical protein